MGYIDSYTTNGTVQVKFTRETAHLQLHTGITPKSSYLLCFRILFLLLTNAVDFTISTSTSNASILAGQMFNMTCTVRTVDGLQNVPIVEWLDETGNRVTTGGDITVGSAMTSGTMTTLALVFSPLPCFPWRIYLQSKHYQPHPSTATDQVC